MFTPEHWPIALALAALSGLLYLAFWKIQKPAGSNHWRDDKLQPIAFVAIPIIATLVLTRMVLYYGMPHSQGLYMGYGSLVLVTVAPAWLLSFVRQKRGTMFLSGAALLAFIMTPVVVSIVHSVGPENAQRFANLPKITVASQDETIPPTNPNKMVLVTQSIAAFKGQTALTTSGGNLGSIYKVEPSAYVLQSVKGHRYWIAPLTFANTWDQLNIGDPVSPGYVVVDAQDPSKDAFLKTGFEMTVFASGNFGQNLGRVLYQAGYTDGKFVSAKFEVDDDWQPHWVVSYVKHPFARVVGREVAKVLVVNVAKRKSTIQEFELGKAPNWVERSMPLPVVEGYLKDYGWYSGDFARSNYWSLFFGVRKDGTLKPSEYDLNYTTDDHSVWVIPMTSTNDTDHSVAGVMVFESNQNSGKFYPGLRGFNVGKTVVDTMFHAPQNVKNFEVEQVQLFSIYGELTWVAIYTSKQSIGRSFAGVGLLHAHGQNSADVVFAPDMQRALTLYASQLAQRKTHGSGPIAREAIPSKQVKSVIKAIAPLPISPTNPTYVFMVQGDNRTFIVTRENYAKAPLVQVGNNCQFSYLDNQAVELAVSDFSCSELEVK